MYVFVIAELQGVVISATLTAALGDICVALQKGVVSPRLHTSQRTTDSQPVCFPISPGEILETEGAGG